MASASKKNAPSADAPNVETENTTLSAPVTRTPVIERGSFLAKRLAENGGLYLTQEEGADLVAAGFASVNMQDIQGDTAFVTLTDAGLALITPAATKGAKQVFEIETVPMPDAPKKRSGKRGSKYPFEKLEVGQSFHVPKTKDMPNPVSALASSLTGARRKFTTPELDASGKPVMETVTVKTYAHDKDGKRIKDASGKFVVASEKKEQRAKTTQVRDFAVHEAAANDPKGPGARVFRTK